MGQVSDQFWGDRCGMFTDPHGYAWTVATHKEDLSPQELDQRQAKWLKEMTAQPAHR
jgi:PhnB protein